MGGENDFRALADEPFQRGQRFLDAGRVVDDHLAVLLLHRDVVIHAHEDPLAAHVQIVDCQFRHSNKGREDSQAAR